MLVSFCHRRLHDYGPTCSLNCSHTERSIVLLTAAGPPRTYCLVGERGRYLLVGVLGRLNLKPLEQPGFWGGMTMTMTFRRV